MVLVFVATGIVSFIFSFFSKLLSNITFRIGVGVLFIVVMRGVWLTTMAPPLRVFSDRTMICRIVARWSVGIVIAGSAMSAIMEVTNSSTRIAACFFVVASPVGVVGALGGVSFGIFFRDLATAFDDGDSVRLAKRFTLIFFIGSILSAIGYFIPLFSGSPLFSGFLILGFTGQLIGGALMCSLPWGLFDRLCVLRIKSEIEWKEFQDVGRTQ
jgi:hypothetical protein